MQKHQEVKPLTTVIIGDYSAKRYGNKVIVQGKNGSVQEMEMNEFFKFLEEHVPNLKSQPEQDTFQKNRATSTDNAETLKTFDYKASNQSAQERFENYLKMMALTNPIFYSSPLLIYEAGKQKNKQKAC